MSTRITAFFDSEAEATSSLLSNVKIELPTYRKKGIPNNIFGKLFHGVLGLARFDENSKKICPRTCNTVRG